MKNFPLYKQEIEDGLSEVILKNTSLNSISLLEPCEAFQIEEKVLQGLKASHEDEESSFDLEFNKSILVSTVWNGNDDFFEALEVWAARYSAKNKPFNIEHESEVIIGHMIGSYPIDEKGNLIPDDVPADDLPNKFHIVSKNVIYKWWRSPEKRQEIAEMIAQIKEKDWFVSVECLFSSFDYALLDLQGNVKIIARNKETSFLTKHLRIYGGTGVYKDYKIGRVPRNLVFSGIGLVKKPANKESEFLTSKKYDFNLISSEKLVYLTDNHKGENMDEKLKLELEAKIEVLTKDLNEYKNSLKASEIKVADFDKVKSDLASSIKLLESANASIVDLNKLKEELEKKYTESVQAATKLADEVNVFKSEKVKLGRISLVSTKLSFDAEKAEKFVGNLSTLGDEQFNSHVESLAASVKVETPATTKTLEEIEKEKNKETPAPNLSLNHDNGVQNNTLQESIAKFVEAVRTRTK